MSDFCSKHKSNDKMNDSQIKLGCHGSALCEILNEVGLWMAMNLPRCGLTKYCT